MNRNSMIFCRKIVNKTILELEIINIAIHKQVNAKGKVKIFKVFNILPKENPAIIEPSPIKVKI